MLRFGFIRPIGFRGAWEEIDLTHLVGKGGLPHSQYAKEYISDLETSDPELYSEYLAFANNRHHPKGSQFAHDVHCDFLIQCLGWVKVGNAIPDAKLVTLTQAYLWHYDILNRYILEYHLDIIPAVPIKSHPVDIDPNEDYN